MFNEIIVNNFSNPVHAGEVENASAVLELGNDVCGDRIKVQLVIEDGLIKRAVYAAWGCATSLATGNIFCARIQQLSIAEATEFSRDDVESMMGELDPSQHHCLEMLHLLFDRLRDISASCGR